jgi:hypothetical protein
MLSSTINRNVNFDVDLQYSVIFFLVKYKVIILQKTFLLRSLYTTLKIVRAFCMLSSTINRNLNFDVEF